MAIYPTSLVISIDSRLDPDAGIDSDRASNGALRSRCLYVADKGTLTLVHRALDATERGTLDAFYVANKLLAVDVGYFGVTYSCRFADTPKYTPLGANLVHATVVFKIA